MIKGDKLPKRFWVKGKSKFMYYRMVEEGISFGNTAWLGIITEAPIITLYKKLDNKYLKTANTLKNKVKSFFRF